MRGSDFILDSVRILYRKYYKVNSRHDDSYTNSPDCIKKAAINAQNKDDECSKYVVTFALNYGKTEIASRKSFKY